MSIRRPILTVAFTLALAWSQAVGAPPPPSHRHAEAVVVVVADCSDGYVHTPVCHRLYATYRAAFPMG
jgi:hypothetical protein